MQVPGVHWSLASCKGAVHHGWRVLQHIIISDHLHLQN